MLSRKLVLTALVMIPVFLGVVCVVEDEWEEGDPCIYELDYDDGFCKGDFVYYCGIDDTVYVTDCYAYCGGTCVSDSYWGAVCECPWEIGGECNYLFDYDKAECDGDNLIYCSETNVIGEVNCYDYCTVDYGADNGYCGFDPDLGYNNCICEYHTCDPDYMRCIDSMSIEWCDGGTIKRQTCDDYCGSKGYCDFDTNQCVCAD